MRMPGRGNEDAGKIIANNEDPKAPKTEANFRDRLHVALL